MVTFLSPLKEKFSLRVKEKKLRLKPIFLNFSIGSFEILLFMKLILSSLSPSIQLNVVALICFIARDFLNASRFYQLSFHNFLSSSFTIDYI